MLGIELLGGFRVTRDGKPEGTNFTARMQALVAYLTLHAGTPISRQQLAFLFWPDSNESQARTNLRQLLHHLRTALPELEQIMDSEGQSVCWSPNPLWSLDADAFLQAAPLVAVSLYKGDLMPGVYEDWIEPHRTRLRSHYEATLEHLAAIAANNNEYTAALRHAEELLSRDILREASYQLLMRLLAQKGDRGGAIAIYERCAQTLTRELGVGPGNATNRLRDEILNARDATPIPAPQTSPLIGRAREWQALLDAWSQTRSGNLTFVMLTGEAGIGKTRLLEELRFHVTATGASAATACCYSTSQALAYTAVADWLRAPAIQAGINDLSVSDRAQIARVLPEILSGQSDIAAPPPFTESWQRRHFFESIAHAILRAPAPILLSIDDLQWCDPETLEWLLWFARSQPRIAVLIAATARMEEVAPEHPVAKATNELRRNAGVRELEVTSLTEKDTLELGAQISGAPLDSHHSAELYQRTRGNPLFVCETIRAGQHAPKVQAVIESRLARLDAQSRQLIEAAAVVGRPFTLEFITPLSGLNESDAIQAIDDLWRHKVVRADDADRYEFIHGCLRDAAYSAIGPARRKQLHRRTAQALEASPVHDGAAQIANHHEQAGEPRKAIPWYQRAAALVRRRFAEDEAIALLTRALKLLERQPESVERDRLELELLLSLGPSLSALYGYAAEDAGKGYARARLLCEVLGETDRYLTVLGGSWTFHVVRSDLEIAREVASRYSTIALASSDSISQAAGNFCLGSTDFFRGAFSDSRFHLDRCMELDRLSPARHFALGPELGVFASGHLIHLLWLMGDTDAALEKSRENLDRARALAHPFSSALALAYDASLRQFLDDPEATDEQANAAAALCRRYGFKYYLSWTPILSGWARNRTSDPAGGLQQMIEGYDALRATGASLRGPYYLGLIAQAAGRSGDLALGKRYLRQALDLGERCRENWVRPELQRIEGDLLLWSGNRADAETQYRNAIRTARQFGAKAWERRAQASLEKISV